MNIFTKTFSIRLKIIFFIFGNVVTVVLFIYLISIAIISGSYSEMEESETVKNIQRANDAIENTVTQLTLKLTDWAFWDDTYEFVNDKNKAYIDSNLGDESMSNLKINGMVFTNTEHEIVFKKVIDFERVEEVSSDDLSSYVLSHKKLTTHETIDSPVDGLIMLPEGMAIVSSQSILQSNGEGPIRGSLIFVQFFNEKMIEMISDLTHLSVELFAFDSISTPSDVLKAKSELLGEATYFVNPISKDKVAGYQILRDVYGDPIMIMKITMPRTIYNNGQTTLYIFLVTTAVSIIIFGLVLVILTEKFIISRLSKLSKEVGNISKDGNLNYRVKVEGEDEIGKLASIINNMLEALSISKNTEQKTIGKLKEVGTELEVRLADMEKMNKLMVDRELKMVELKKEIDELKSKN